MESTEKTTLPALKPVGITSEELTKLRDDYKSLAVTEPTLKQADNARLVLKNKRLEIQRIQKDNNDILNKFKKDNEAKADSLIGIIEPTEKLLNSRIKQVQEEIDRKAKDVKEKEEKRITGHKNRISVANKVIAQGAIAENDLKLDELKKLLEDNFGDHDFEEFKSEAQGALINANTVLKQRKEFLDLKAAQPVKEPEVKKEESKPDLNKSSFGSQIKDSNEPYKHSPGTFNDSDTIKMVNGFTKTNVNSEYDEWICGGFKFGFPKELDIETKERMQSCLQEIIDNMEM